MKHPLWLLPLAVLAAGGCAMMSREVKLAGDPFYESFFAKCRLIMLKEELEIYEHLPTVESKKEFIEDFWKKRDPDPLTEENEFKKEFENRITYANRWFREGRGPEKGWDTERGRILLILGFPNNREWGTFVSGEYYYPRLGGEIPRSIERWVYDDLQMELIFVDLKGFGDFRLDIPPPQLGSAMEATKASYIWGENKTTQPRISFDAAVREGQLVIEVPVKKIIFEKEAGLAKAKLRVRLTTYLQYQKKETRTFDQDISEKEEKILEKKNWEIVLPLQLAEAGKYTLEIVLTDEKGGSAYLKYLQHTHKTGN